jgi:hypothetical protein
MIVSQSCSVAFHCVNARLEVCSASAPCGTQEHRLSQEGGSKVQSAVAVVSELRSGQLALWEKVGSHGHQRLWSGVSGQHGRALSAR